MANGTDRASITFTIEGKRASGDTFSLTAIQNFAKAKIGAQGAQGVAGANAVVFSLYAPNGNVFTNQTIPATLPINTARYEGSTEISSNATYVWKKYVSGNWDTISNETANSLVVNANEVAGVQSYQCIMTYKTKEYTDTITLIDKTDNYQAEIESTAGDVFKNTIGETFLICRLWQNGAEVDAPKLYGTYVLGSTSATPTGPSSGYFYYHRATGNNTTLKKYSGSAWGNASGADLHTKTYEWFKRDKNGEPVGPSPYATGKVIYISGADVDDKATFTCEVK